MLRAQLMHRHTPPGCGGLAWGGWRLAMRRCRFPRPAPHCMQQCDSGVHADHTVTMPSLCGRLIPLRACARPLPCRSARRRAKADGPYDTRFLPVMLTCCMVMSMSVVFGGAVMRLGST